MGSKCKIIIFSLLISLFILFLPCCRKTDNYSDKIISVFQKYDVAKTKDIFTFDFHHAYYFDDPYMSGEGFADRYDLDISIDQVESGVSENIGRIVFVNNEGEYIYEFKFDKNKLTILDEGCIIYPDTAIERISSLQEKELIIYFHSSEYIEGAD